MKNIISRKDLIRKAYLEKRKELSSKKFHSDSQQVFEKTIEIINKYKPKCIHCFLPINSKYEINTLPIIKYCWDHNIDVLVPVSNFKDSTLKSAEFNRNTKTINTKNNITEPFEPVFKNPKDIDIVITPLLAFDSDGYRIGYGKGFYDRFFTILNKDVKRIGLSLFAPCQKIENRNMQDIPLTHCITPEIIYSF